MAAPIAQLPKTQTGHVKRQRSGRRGTSNRLAQSTNQRFAGKRRSARGMPMKAAINPTIRTATPIAFAMASR
jgi:hypothetical protein